MRSMYLRWRYGMLVAERGRTVGFIYLSTLGCSASKTRMIIMMIGAIITCAASRRGVVRGVARSSRSSHVRLASRAGGI